MEWSDYLECLYKKIKQDFASSGQALLQENGRGSKEEVA